MRTIVEMVAGEKIDLKPFGIDLSKHKINQVWTIFDLDRMKNWCKFDPYTGMPTNFKTLEELPLQHREGIFLEDFIHDWNIRPGQKFDYYSRVSEQGRMVQLLIEFDLKES